MIKVVRVDYRLIHGQVAVSWVRKTGVDYLVVADDAAANDALVKMTMKLAQPDGVGMDILPTEKVIALTKKGRYQRKKVMVVCGNMKEAAQLVAGLNPQEAIKAVVIGNVKAKEGSRNYNRAVDLNAAELQEALHIIEAGAEIHLQLFPDSEPQVLDAAKIQQDIKEMQKGGE